MSEECAVYVVPAVLYRVADVKKNVSRSESGTFFMSVVRLVSTFTGKRMSVSSVLWRANS